jgi:hypothetical protein
MHLLTLSVMHRIGEEQKQPKPNARTARPAAIVIAVVFVLPLIWLSRCGSRRMTTSPAGPIATSI